MQLFNCLIAGFPSHGIYLYGNRYVSVETGAVLLQNCTVAGNGMAGLFIESPNDINDYYGPFVRNSIIAKNALTMNEPKLDIMQYNRRIDFADDSIAYSSLGATRLSSTKTIALIIKILNTTYIESRRRPTQTAS